MLNLMKSPDTGDQTFVSGSNVVLSSDSLCRNNAIKCVRTSQDYHKLCSVNTLHESLDVCIDHVLFYQSLDLRLSFYAIFTQYHITQRNNNNTMYKLVIKFN